jgi:hypothetical protein
MLTTLRRFRAVDERQPNSWRDPKSSEELLRLTNLKITMDTYVQAVSEEKRNAQSKVVKMLLPGIRRAVI